MKRDDSSEPNAEQRRTVLSARTDGCDLDHTGRNDRHDRLTFFYVPR